MTIWQLLGGLAFVVGALIEVYAMARSVSFEVMGAARGSRPRRA